MLLYGRQTLLASVGTPGTGKLGGKNQHSRMLPWDTSLDDHSHLRLTEIVFRTNVHSHLHQARTLPAHS